MTPWIALKYTLGLLVALLVAGTIAAAVVWGIGASRAARDALNRLGQPTPEEARVKVERAITKETTRTEAEIDAIRNADNDALVRRARELRERGRKPTNDR